MINSVFNTNFYSLITPPNKQQILDVLTNLECDKKLTKKLNWNEGCKVKVEVLNVQETGQVLLIILVV